ncbi:MAG TPA: TraI domain-containing protein [Planctomycetota bacterium]|nr:TraI domain-containing protein [Planctomycetota bacterium]
MLKHLERMMGLRGHEGAEETQEAFGEVRIARERGMEILRATPERRSRLQGIRDFLSSMTRSDKDELVDRVLARVALFVFDLPASKAHHHARRFGLLDHLLEVAHLTARELSSPGFEISPDPSLNHRERPMWVYAGVVAALAHDIGKTLDLDVLAPGTATAWDPKAEPLRAFCQRNHLGETGPALWTYHPGRGLHDHVRRIPDVLPLVFPTSIALYLGSRLDAVIHALSAGRDFRTAPDLSWAACEVVKVVSLMDRTSVAADRNPNGGMEELDPPEIPGGGLASAADGKALRVPAPGSLEGDPKGPEMTGMSPDVTRSARLHAPKPEASSNPPIPTDFWPDRVPSARNRRGDPEENRRRLAAELAPSRFLTIVRRMIVMCRLSRNDLYTDVYLRPDYVWLVIPRALRQIAIINHLPFDTEVVGMMLRSLAASPQVEPWSKEHIPVYMKPRPSSATYQAVRIKTVGFIAEGDLAGLGTYSHEIRTVGLEKPSTEAGEGSRDRL